MSNDRNLLKLPGVDPSPEAMLPNDEVVALLGDLLKKAEAGELQAVCIAFSGFDSEPIHGSGKAGHCSMHSCQLNFQLDLLKQKLLLNSSNWVK